MHHSQRRVEQGMRTREFQGSSPSNNTVGGRTGFTHNDFSDEDLEYSRSRPNRVLPYINTIKLKWKLSFDSEIPDPGFVDVGHRPVVVKERSIFVGCIPDGIENIGEILQTLMEGFLERFDFAPFELSQVQVVKLVKDFGFLELATDKVAQIVLAANQLDVFEWGFNGCHFNIEGCNETYTSVRPLYEYLPLKPARVVFVGNIPELCWKTEYLEEVFTKILWGSDGQTELKPVVAVYLLPESSDAYVELASEFIADALIYKCTKNDQLLKEIGDEVFICRDVNSPPMMSRHKVEICPQRSFFIGISARDEYFKIDCVRKVFDEILPLISRKMNQYAYLEYVSIQPGNDYAFFQFNSDVVADAIMDEYIENTQLFVCKDSLVTYIILRPPEYVRPGARYHQVINHRRLSGQPNLRYEQQKKGAFHANTGRRQFSGGPRMGNSGGDHPGGLMQAPREYDEPAKKADCVMSIGATRPPVAIWNGPGATSADPESLIVIEGIPKGFNYKLLRGALNELFERTLAQTGLLDVGMLILGYLDRDEDFDLVGCLPSPEFVNALLSLRKKFVVCGHEVRLLAKDGMHNSDGRRGTAVTTWNQDEFGSSDEEAAYVGGSFHNGDAIEWNSNGFPKNCRRGYSETAGAHDMTQRGPAVKRKFPNAVSDDWYHNPGLRNMSSLPKEELHNQESDHDWNNAGSGRGINRAHWPRKNFRGNASYACKDGGFSAVENRGFIRSKDVRNALGKGMRRLN
ncbi:hypothetical protein KP509_02G086700 [Ceratopteris richardii]|nr:hypothetical protein KP509_02G086700 [Ceratopteris richardii]